MACWTRIALTTALLTAALSAGASPYPDVSADGLISGDAQYSPESPIYQPPAESPVTRSCIYIQPPVRSSSISYTTAYHIASSEFSSLLPTDTQPLLSPIDASLSAACIDKPEEHITLTLSRPDTTAIRTTIQSQEGEHSWDYPQTNDTLPTLDPPTESSVDVNGTEPNSNIGKGFEYWHILYDNGPLTDGRFYSMFFEKLENGRTQTGGISLVFGTYALSDSGFVADAVKSANSIEADIFIKQYGDQILFIASPYALFSVGYGFMWYDFRYPVLYSDGYTSSGEQSRYIEIHAGLGGELGRYGILQLSAYAGADVRIYYWDNYSDYSAELFQDTIAFTLGTSIGLRN